MKVTTSILSNFKALDVSLYDIFQVGHTDTPTFDTHGITNVDEAPKQKPSPIENSDSVISKTSNSGTKTTTNSGTKTQNGGSSSTQSSTNNSSSGDKAAYVDPWTTLLVKPHLKQVIGSE